jgi:hypothetical protein
MNTYGNSAFPMNTYAAESGYYAPGAEFDPLAPFNRVETIDVCMCHNCGQVEVSEDGDNCKECQAVEDGMCCSCYAEPIRNKESDVCEGCYCDAVIRNMEQH